MTTPNTAFTPTDPAPVVAPVAPAPVPAPAPAPVVASPVRDSLVGEGKKFTSDEEMAKGKVESDAFIIKLQNEQAELREELDKRLSAEETLARIQETSKTSNENTSQVSADNVTDLVKQTVQQMSEDETAKVNVMKADSILAAKYGDKRGEVVAAKAKELGVTLEFLEDTAAKSPSAFLGMMGETTPAQPTPNAAVNGSVNTDAMSQVNAGPKDDSYASFETLRKENPKEYFKPETQNKMLRLAAANPDFYKN